MELAKKLAELHSKYGVYSTNSFRPGSKNIITSLNDAEFAYLKDFYQLYIDNYPATSSVKIMNDKRARNKDLFFIGEGIIKTGLAKFFLVFEGSQSAVEKLSITVLAHLWLLQDDNPIVDEFCGKDKWWDSASNYFSLKNKLKMQRKFAVNAYIIDGVRLEIDKKDKRTNNKFNHELLFEEIKLLKPKLVVCIGSAARDLVGMKYIDQDTKFHSVRFPKYHNEVEEYKELSAIMEKIHAVGEK